VKVEKIPGGTERLLLVDDEDAILDMFGQMLTHLGYVVTKTSEPAEALAWVGEEPDRFQLLITDMAMPKMSGDRLTAAAKEIKPGLPVILCTGCREGGDGAERHAAGADGVLYKPFRLEAMARAIRDVFDDDSPA
jgi:CheY-like chemotaxis protein